jgi:hypothetical protein
MLGWILCRRASASHGLVQKMRCTLLRRGRGHVPRLDDNFLERREVLSPFPFTGAYSGGYSVIVEGPGLKETVSGTISVSITATSVQPFGDGLDQAFISGSVTVTGFLGQSFTFPYAGNSEQENGIEVGNATLGTEPSAEIDITANDPNGTINNVFIESECGGNAIDASCNIVLNGYFTPNAATVVLGGPGAPGSPPSTPAPVELTGGSLVRANKGANDIVVDFIGPFGGGSGLPVSDFRLTAVPEGRRHAVVIPLKTATYDEASDTMTLVPRRKQKFKLPLELTVEGLAGGPYTSEIDSRG